MNAHIGLSHTPFHLLQYGLIAPEAVTKGERFVVFHEGQVPDGIPGLADCEIIEMPASTGYRDGRLLAKANARRVLAHSAWEGTPTLYSSDLKWLTNNLVYFARPRAQRQQHTVLITDGLGSYLTRDDAGRTTATAMTKSLLGLVGYGPWHRPLLGHHLGLDRRYASRVLGFQSDRIVGDIDKCDLPLPLDCADVVAGPGASLVVGVPLDDHRYSEKAARAIIDGMAQQASHLSFDGQTRWYKPHHFEAEWVAEAYLERGFRLLDDRRPAEILVREMGIRRLFGTYSSVLAFGPQFTNSRCEAFSVCFDEFAKGYLNQRDASELRGILADFGVTFV